MRRIIFTSLVLLTVLTVKAQNDTVKRKITPVASLPRSNDHIMLQLGYTTWTGAPDSISTTGIPRTFNAYFLFDFPFKTNPHWSVGIGVGIATDNIYFDKTYVGIKDATPTLHFTNVSDTNHFKRSKLATAYAEAPLELRYNFNPEAKNSVKVAIGAKIGTLLNAHTKEKNLEDKNGNALLAYTQKESSKRFFNQNRLSLTARIGYGHWSVFGAYAVTPLFKEGVAPAIRPLTIGLTLSGL